MQPRRFEALARRLLRAGIARRHVHRYVVELREHYEDAVSAEVARGASQAHAEELASARLGTDEDLARSLLAQPELRSAAARFPALFFGLVPTIVWLGLLALTLGTIRVLSVALLSNMDDGPAWAVGAIHGLCVLYVRVLPIVLGALMLTTSLRQGVSLPWPLFGAACVNVLAGTVTVHLIAAGPGYGDQLGVSSAFLPFLFPSFRALGQPDAVALLQGLGRALGMLALTATPYLLLRRRERLSVNADG